MLNCIPSWLFLCHILILRSNVCTELFFFWLSFRKILSNHNATMSCARKIPSSLVTAGMLLKNIAICRFLILNNDRVCSLLNQSLLVCILFWLTHCCLVSDFSFFFWQCLDLSCSFGFSREYVLLHEGSAEWTKSESRRKKIAFLRGLKRGYLSSFVYTFLR